MSKHPAPGLRGSSLIVFLACLSFVLPSLAGEPQNPEPVLDSGGALHSPRFPGAEKLSPLLRTSLAIRSERVFVDAASPRRVSPARPSDLFPGFPAFPRDGPASAPSVAFSPDRAAVTLHLLRRLRPRELARLERAGLEVERLALAGEAAGRPVIVGPMIAGFAAWDRLEDLAALPEVLWIEPSRNPFRRSPLDFSAFEVGAEYAWVAHPSGNPIRGQGVVLADLDTGVDVFHPLFFRADGDTLAWLDTDGDFRFSPGIDHVDLNGNGLPDAGELLDMLPGVVEDWFGTTNTDGEYDATLDWLYNDANANGVRDYGPGAGFTESDPTYGERLFIPKPPHTQVQLIPGDELIALGTSKIKAVLNSGGVVRTRGVDLIHSEPDAEGHGTSVCGILAGGEPAVHKFVGIAPDADLVVADLFDNSELACAIFAQSQGADVMLWEAAEWIANPMDGSWTMSFLIDAFADSGIAQVAPAGNLGAGRKHARATLSGGIPSSHTLNLDVPAITPSISNVWVNLLWRPGPNASQIEVILQRPTGAPITLAFDGIWKDYGTFFVNSDLRLSSRGTYYTYIEFLRWNGSNFLPLETGNYEFQVTVNGGSLPFDLHAYVLDDVTTWEGGAEFASDRDSLYTVTAPALADSACTVGSYSTRGYFGTAAGNISPFSPSGPRVDGVSLLDLAAPGHYDIYTGRSSADTSAGLGEYVAVLGTSAAAPHVAAGLGLIRQVYPGYGPARLEQALMENALQDGFTGMGYSERWGFGKLRIFETLFTTGAEDLPPAVDEIVLGPNVPNPFNPATEIRFVLPSQGHVRLRVYDVAGRSLVTLLDEVRAGGPGRVIWNGRADSGADLASGVYFYELKFEGWSVSRKMILLR